MDALSVVLAILGGLLVLWLLVVAVAMIQTHRSDDAEMEALWFVAAPVWWLLRWFQRPPRGGTRS